MQKSDADNKEIKLSSWKNTKKAVSCTCRSCTGKTDGHSFHRRVQMHNTQAHDIMGYMVEVLPLYVPRTKKIMMMDAAKRVDVITRADKRVLIGWHHS